MSACFTTVPMPHPWEKAITDTACGYEFLLVDAKCQGCHRSREEGPEDQLRKLHAMGRAAAALGEALARKEALAKFGREISEEKV